MAKKIINTRKKKKATLADMKFKRKFTQLAKSQKKAARTGKSTRPRKVV